jgi:biopolymer transport protein ExbD
MAGATVAEPKSSVKKGKKQKKKKRIPVRIDMTPMVDVVMLLITFFMLTTVFNTPQTMEINLPPNMDTRVEVSDLDLMTLRVIADGTILWNMGIEPPVMVEFKDLRQMLVAKLKDRPKLITLVKVEREGTYEMMVNLMDELNLSNITRFSIAPFKQYDKDIVKRVLGT